MLTPSQIGRFIAQRDHRRLIDRLLSNGRCHSRRAQALLHEPEAMVPASLGLGLQRICELAYWPVSEGSDLAHALMRLQRRDGCFGPPHAVAQPQHLLAGTAIALRGLIEWSAAFSHRDDEQRLIERAIERGLNALHAQWHHQSDSECDLAWAIVLWQLGDDDAARRHLPIDAIRSRLACVHGPEVLADDLPRLALTMAA